jgi:predicted nucleic acid-binding protein
LRGHGLVENLLLTASRRLLLDTSAIIYFLNGTEPYATVMTGLFRRVQAGSATAVVSTVTEAELLVLPERRRDTAAKQQINDLLSEDGIEVVSMDRRIALTTAVLCGRESWGLADAIIVATGLETGCDAIVGNDGKWSKKRIEVPFAWLDEICRQK